MFPSDHDVLITFLGTKPTTRSNQKTWLCHPAMFERILFEATHKNNIPIKHLFRYGYMATWL